jgi:hypothetical protein
MAWDFWDEKQLPKIIRTIQITYFEITRTMNGADDCSQWVIEKNLRDGNKGQSTYHAVIDYLRDTSGKKKTKNYEIRAHLNFADRLDSPKYRNLIATDTVERSNAKIDCFRLLKPLSPRYQDILYMRFVEECTLDSIGESLGITESGAGKLVEYAINKIQNDIKGANVVEPIQEMARKLEALRIKLEAAEAEVKNKSKDASFWWQRYQELARDVMPLLHSLELECYCKVDILTKCPPCNAIKRFKAKYEDAPK